MEKEFTDPVSTRALEKWSRERLEKTGETGGRRSYRYRYSGSTCTDGGTPFEAYMNVELSGLAEQTTVEKAWIDFREKEKESAARMCAASGGPSRSQQFFEKLAENHDIAGRRLEDIITEKVSVNYAGCFCAPAMVRDKWNQALSTVHWYELNGN
jgi:hypothetical protein